MPVESKPMHTLDSHLRYVRKLHRRPTPTSAQLLGGKHPQQPREFDMAARTVLLADGAILDIDVWMAAC